MTSVKWSYMAEERLMKASEFKARCLAVLDDVQDSGREVTITKHGRPVARLVPVGERPSLRGSVTYNISDEDLIAPIPEVWDAEEE